MPIRLRINWYENGDPYLVGMKETAILHPSDTILLAEKNSQRGDFYMDIKAGNGDDFVGAVEQSRHDSRGAGSGNGGGGSELRLQPTAARAS